MEQRIRVAVLMVASETLKHVVAQHQVLRQGVQWC
jgi:hypothetical protein